MNIIPFDQSAALPAHIAKLFGNASPDDLSANTGGGFPVISIKGKVFHIVRGDERTLVTKPDTPDEPAGSLELVLLKANPHLSKTYYSEGFVEGSAEKPDCYSNDGVAPAADSQKPQSTKCATCPKNQWGSKITDNGSKGKACADVRRMAVAPAGQINDPMLLRVPAASLKPLAEYGQMLAKRGVPYQAVVTKVGFDYSVAHPALTFKAVGFLDAAGAKLAAETLDSDIVAQILGHVEVPVSAQPANEDAPAETTKPAAAEKPAAEKPAAKTKAAPKAAEEDAAAAAAAAEAAKKREAAKKKAEAARLAAEAAAAAAAAAEAEADAEVIDAPAPTAKAKPNVAPWPLEDETPKATVQVADSDLEAAIGGLLDGSFDD